MEYQTSLNPPIGSHECSNQDGDPRVKAWRSDLGLTTDNKKHQEGKENTQAHYPLLWQMVTEGALPILDPRF